ncbi:MAG TPA: anti-sigma regulatory factor [Candidatus Obscuribacterales bacterium]
MRKILTFVGCETLNILQQSIYETTTDPKALKDVLAWFDGFHALPIPQGDWLQCQLALIEGFTNAVRHAHKDLPHATPIAIAVTVTEAYLDMQIWDYGPGFDFSAMLHQKLETTTADSEGGRGLRIMYRVADVVEYGKTSDQRNCLHIRKVFDPQKR